MSDWLQQARRAANAPPIAARTAVLIAGRAAGGDRAVGSVEPGLAERLAGAGLPVERTVAGLRITGATDDSLQAIAHWLHAAGVCATWRGERLDVVDAQGKVVGAVERGAARALGITTFAVHLVGWRADGRVWVQQRAFDKATDAGAWDTLVGGLVAAGESIAMTLARESIEEAGLALDVLHDLRGAGRITVHRPVAEGYMVEHIEVFRAVVPEGIEPVNRDGEVERFDCLDRAALVERLRASEFTLEASLILGGEIERGD